MRDQSSEFDDNVEDMDIDEETNPNIQNDPKYERSDEMLIDDPNENWFATGGSWVINRDLTVVKARLVNSGTLKTVLQHNIKDQKS